MKMPKKIVAKNQGVPYTTEIVAPGDANQGVSSGKLEQQKLHANAQSFHSSHDSSEVSEMMSCKASVVGRSATDDT